MNESTHSRLSMPLALVTGATSGIGRAAAIRLAADGFDVLVHGRDAACGAGVVEHIMKAGGLRPVSLPRTSTTSMLSAPPRSWLERLRSW